MIERRPLESLGAAHHGWLDARHHFSLPNTTNDRAGRFVTLASGAAGDEDALPIRADARVLGTTLKAVMGIVREHSGAYGMGVDYAYTMVHKASERVKHGERIGPNPAK
jgi:hypothetical protein